MNRDLFYHEYYSNGICYKTEEKSTNEKFEALLDLVSSLQDRIEELESASRPQMSNQMSNEITLDQALKLVEFAPDDKGNWQVHAVNGDCVTVNGNCGIVQGDCGIVRGFCRLVEGNCGTEQKEESRLVAEPEPLISQVNDLIRVIDFIEGL